MIALHVLVLAIVVVLVSLGAWQVDRLGQASERAAAIEERLAAPAVEATALLTGLSLEDEEALAALEFRPATATGVWQPQDEVLQRGRSHVNGAGYGVLTPLRLEDGSTLLVRRGTVPFDNDLEPPVPAAAPAEGTVTVTGTLERSVPQPTSAFTQRDPAEGELDVVFNADLDRIGPQLEQPVLPMVLRLEQPVPAGDGLPVPSPAPEADRGPHLSYAVQWFSFAAIAGGMYLLWLWRRARGDVRAVATGSRVGSTRAQGDQPGGASARSDGHARP